jgi:hypothetical protein
LDALTFTLLPPAVARQRSIIAMALLASEED